MTERKTLAQLLGETPGRKSLEVEVVGVVHSMEKLEAKFQGKQWHSDPEEGNLHRGLWIVDNSREGEVLAAKTYLWNEQATQLGEQLAQAVERGEAPILSVSPIEISYLHKATLGTKRAGGTTFKLDPPLPLAGPLSDRELCDGLRSWYRGEGMAESAEVAAISGRRLQRAKVQPGPKAAAFGAATMGVAPRKKAADKRGASAGASAQDHKKKQKNKGI